MNCSLYGNYRTRKFTDIYPSVSDFLSDYNNTNEEFENGIPPTISSDSANTLYYLLYAKYGNSHISSSDETQFKYKLLSIIYQYGPTWEKRLDIQNDLRELTEDEILSGSKQINDHAYNPSTIIDNGPNSVDGEIESTNEQTRTKFKRGKLDGYVLLMQSLQTDVTEEFLTKFKKLFLTIVKPEQPLWYVSEEE